MEQFSQEKFKKSALSKFKEISLFFNKTADNSHTTSKISRNYAPLAEKQEPLKISVENQRNNFSQELKRIVDEVEQNRREDVKNNINKHILFFNSHEAQQEIKNNIELEEKRKKLIKKAEQEESNIIKALERYEEEGLEQHQALLAYYQLLQDRRKLNLEKIKRNEEHEHQRVQIIENIKRKQVEFREIYQEIVNIIRSCQPPIDVKVLLEDVRSHLQTLPDQMNEIVERCQRGKVSAQDNIKADECILQLMNLKGIIFKKIEAIDSQNKTQSIDKQITTTTSVENDVSTTNNIQKFISNSSLKYYSELENFLQSYSANFRNILEDNSLKQFRFNCKKAVNIPVNAISPVSSQHLLDKYNRLCNLLLGNKVIVGGTEVIASKHPEGISFCIDLLAKKFVLQADLMISSNPEAAFCYATVILSLWNQFPEFGRLFLLHMHKECPYLIPFHPPKLVGQSDEDYYKSLGYHYVDGVVEKQDKFLKRMTGIMRLYAAIVISKPKSEQKSSPHSIDNGWRWLAAILNLEPRMDITATMIHTFLEFAGSTLQIIYGKQFTKLVSFICKVYMPMLKQFDSGGPFTRLEVLLQDYQKTGQFEEPKGMLPHNFW